MSIDGYIPPHIECPTGYVWDTFKTPSGETIWWQFFLVPATLCIIMGFVFLAFFRDDPKVTEEDLKGV